MKYLIFSDLHGSEATTKRVLAYFASFDCDKIILLGDILYHGPRNPIPPFYNPQGVMALLNPLRERIIAVRGNCESEADQMMLEFPCMGDYAVINDPNMELFATHGHLYSPDNLPDLSQKALFLYGHTHIWQLEKRVEGTVICNPGSITLPKGGNEATFALFDNGEITIRTLETGAVLAAMSL